jgi:hypothetical protein
VALRVRVGRPGIAQSISLITTRNTVCAPPQHQRFYPSPPRLDKGYYQPMLTISTLGHLIEGGYTLETYCLIHGAQGKADLDGLAAKLGRDFCFIGDALLKHLPCPDCLRDMEFRVHPPGQPDMGGAHNMGTRKPSSG